MKTRTKDKASLLLASPFLQPVTPFLAPVLCIVEEAELFGTGDILQTIPKENDTGV